MTKLVRRKIKNFSIKSTSLVICYRLCKSYRLLLAEEGLLLPAWGFSSLWHLRNLQQQLHLQLRSLAEDSPRQQGGGPVSSVALLISPPEFSCKRTSLAAGGGAVSSVEFSCRRVCLLWLPSSAAAGGGAVSAACLFLRITMCEVLGFPWTSRNYMQFLMANFNSVYIPQHITSNAKQP